MLTSYLQTLLFKAMHGDTQAYQEYQSDKLSPKSNYINLPTMEAMNLANRDFLAFALSQENLSQCPTRILEDIINSAKIRNTTTEQHTRLIALLRKSINQNKSPSKKQNKHGLYEAMILYHLFIQKSLTAGELEQACNLEQDSHGVAEFIKGIVLMMQNTADENTVKHLQNAVNAGHLKAMFNLGCMHMDGRVRDTLSQIQHDAIAVELFRRAVKAGHIYGLFNLALLHKQGRVRDERSQAQHDAVAVTLYQRAHDAGLQSALAPLQALKDKIQQQSQSKKRERDDMGTDEQPQQDQPSSIITNTLSTTDADSSVVPHSTSATSTESLQPSKKIHIEQSQPITTSSTSVVPNAAVPHSTIYTHVTDELSELRKLRSQQEQEINQQGDIFQRANALLQRSRSSLFTSKSVVPAQQSIVPNRLDDASSVKPTASVTPANSTNDTVAQPTPDLTVNSL